uniref:Uncharacterized protein n=1 Tax=Arundo donax TaxID=35708 RepID=A0A0A9AHE6_ARUDO
MQSHFAVFFKQCYAYKSNRTCTVC